MKGGAQEPASRVGGASRQSNTVGDLENCIILTHCLGMQTQFMYSWSLMFVAAGTSHTCEQLISVYNRNQTSSPRANQLIALRREGTRCFSTTNAALLGSPDACANEQRVSSVPAPAGLSCVSVLRPRGLTPSRHRAQRRAVGEQT